jgi:hypothetical protein
MIDSNNGDRSQGNPQDASRRQQSTQNSHGYCDHSRDAYRYSPGDEIAWVLCLCLGSGGDSGNHSSGIVLLSNIADLRRTALVTKIRFRFDGCAAAMTQAIHMLKLNYPSFRRNHM